MSYSRSSRAKRKISSTPVNTVDAQGTAYLCFPEDHSWFQGNVSTEDLSNISLYGERVIPENSSNSRVIVSSHPKTESQSKKLGNSESDEENNNADNTNTRENFQNSSNQTYYRVSMIDHFSGLKYTLPKIYVGNLENPSCGLTFSSENGEVGFQVENVYKGEKAKMMVQKYIGSPTSLGEKCFLYSGQINILFDESNDAVKSCWCL